MDPSAYRCLLLNSTYEPMRAIGWRRAVTLVWRQKVDVVSEYEVAVRSPSSTLTLPAVVRVRRYVRAPRKSVRCSRRNVYLRDRGVCQYCCETGALHEMTIDHVHPRSRGGPHAWENVALACARCNRVKAARTPEEAGMRLLRRPFRPRWLAAGRHSGDPRHTPAQWEPWVNLGGAG